MTMTRRGGWGGGIYNWNYSFNLLRLPKHNVVSSILKGSYYISFENKGAEPRTQKRLHEAIKMKWYLCRLMVAGGAMSNKFQSKQPLKCCFNWTLPKEVLFSLISKPGVHLKFYIYDLQDGWEPFWNSFRQEASEEVIQLWRVRHWEQKMDLILLHSQ